MKRASHSEECNPSSPANQTFLFPIKNATVQHLYTLDDTPVILTWTQAQEPFNPPDFYDARFTNNPVDGFVLFTERGEGKFKGTVRFRNPVTDFCVTTLVFDMEAFLTIARPCDLEDENQVGSKSAWGVMS
jgi:hypothetical protein